MSKSVARVQAAAERAGLSIDIKHMSESTRSAAEAAAACKCHVGQIVKSLIFSGGMSGELKLLLVSGAHSVDLERAAGFVGEPLQRADPRIVRKVTGFAIGGVSPIGHLTDIATWMDETLLAHPIVWAAAGAPNALFAIAPTQLQTVANAACVQMTAAPQKRV
ncbi:MAG: YbaK/EbsC family protein [Neomegalonema sp.]|nr:YbaK/EbsC family protein [Neomegalonema sp.]